MIWFIIVIIIALVWGVREWKEWELADGVFACVWSLLIGGIIALILAFVLPAIFNFPRICVEKETKPLISFRDNTNTIHGQFFLGCGELSGMPTYVFYTKTKNGGYLLNSQKANHCIVYEKEESPHITYYDIKFSKKWYYLFAINIGKMCRSKIIIPPNSMTKNIYQLDLK